MGSCWNLCHNICYVIFWFLSRNSLFCAQSSVIHDGKDFVVSRGSFGQSFGKIIWI
jgi:hypothetical protein